jgi:hypothetical protein
MTTASATIAWIILIKKCVEYENFTNVEHKEHFLHTNKFIEGVVCQVCSIQKGDLGSHKKGMYVFECYVAIHSPCSDGSSVEVAHNDGHYNGLARPDASLTVSWAYLSQKTAKDFSEHVPNRVYSEGKENAICT